MIHRLIAIFSICMLVSACAVWPFGSTPSTINVVSKPIDIMIAQPIDPAPVRFNTVTFKVVNKDNLDSFLQSISKSQGNINPVFIAITTTDYENLSLNLADLRRYIQEQQAVIVYYKNLTTHTDAQ